jgi:TolA-binding protein
MSHEDQDLVPPRYRSPELVASGGMGDVYRAVDEVLDREVAIKMLAERYSTDDSVRARFRHEALAAARLSGEPDTVTIFDVGEWREQPFIVMEYLGGGTLADRMKSGAQTPARALGWLDQAAASLDAAHRNGVVHRDVKPSNLLLDSRGSVHVGDFGIARAAGLDSNTLTGTILGTAGYLAPEQAQGEPVTAAADRYALAVVAYELLTGARPFAKATPTAEALAHVRDPVPPASLRNPALPRTVDRVFELGLAKRPEARYPTCAAFVAALRHALARKDADATVAIVSAARDQPTVIVRHRARRTGLAAAATALAILAAGLAGALLARSSRQTPAAAPAHTKTITTTTVRSTTTGQPVRSPTTSQASATDLNTRGYRLMLAGSYSAALPLLRQAVAGLSDPSNPVTAYANFNLGQTLVRLGQCGAAIRYLQRAQQLEPSRSVVSSALAYAQQCSGPAHRTPPGHKPHPPHPAHGGRGDQGDQGD